MRRPLARHTALVACVLLAVSGRDGHADVPRSVDGERLNETIATLRTFGGNPNGGSQRVAYSEANKNALGYLEELMRAAGLDTHIDFAGNLVGRKTGRVAGRNPLISGSHIDTVPNGGHYDGIVGAMAAIEVARTLHDAGHTLDHPLEIVVWSNEEGGKTGSRAWNGSVTEFEFDLESLGNRTLGDGIRYLGGDPTRIRDVKRATGSVAGYVELHVEQGALLDRDRIAIGVVEGIVGIKRWNVTVTGFANHAGTTPMSERRDALYAASRMIAAVREVMLETSGRHVGTVGRVRADPGAPNVIPGSARFSVEIRDLSMEKIDVLFSAVEERFADIAEATSTEFRAVQFYESPAAIADAAIRQAVADSAEDLNLSYVHMPSGAGHDAQSLAPLGPIGMIFVPSVDGISHAPAEHTEPRAIVDGANVLLATLLRLDAVTY